MPAKAFKSTFSRDALFKNFSEAPNLLSRKRKSTEIISFFILPQKSLNRDQYHLLPLQKSADRFIR